jgi:PAS domain S-box-containing protein
MGREVAKAHVRCEELDWIVDSSFDGICVVDGEGTVLRVNPAWIGLAGPVQVQEEVEGKCITDLGASFPVEAIQKALADRQRQNLVWEARGGRRVLISAVPMLDEVGGVRRVVATARDLTEFARRKRVHPQSGGFVPSDSDSSDMVAYSQAMEHVLELVHKVSHVGSTVLITGESGVGKEVVARYIHRTGERAGGPFVKINCGAIPETLLESELFGYETGAFTGAKREGKPGLMELAAGGTLFLDEISEIPMGIQVKLLQVLQEKRFVRVGGTRQIGVDARIIAATNRDLVQMVKDGLFRADLFYRLNVIPIAIPPLRERAGDIPPLIHHFLAKWNRKYGRDREISRAAREMLQRYSWPGNVRELENIIEFLVVTVDDPVIGHEHLPERIKFGRATAGAEVYVSSVVPLKDAVEEVERQLLQRASEANPSTYAIARALGVNQSTVVRKVKKYLGTRAGQRNA